MNLIIAFNSWWQADWMEILGGALLHSLWQGAILWAGLMMILSGKGITCHPATKHRLVMLTVTLLALCPVITSWFIVLESETTPVSAVSPNLPREIEPSPDQSQASHLSQVLKKDEVDRVTESAVKTSPSQQLVREYEALHHPWRSCTAMLWMLGVSFMTLRWMLGWGWLRKLTSSKTAADARLQELLQQAFRLSGGREVSLWMLDRLAVPLLIGVIRPAIYFPARLVSKLSDKEIEALLLHEIAHLRRGDAVSQLWLSVVESLMFYHPAVWSCGKQARGFAEMACDDQVVEWMGDRRGYAQALMKVEDWRGEGLVLAASGSDGGLKSRLLRILGISSNKMQQKPWLRRISGFTLILLVVYLLFWSVGIPKLAKVWSDEERGQLIAAKKDALKMDEREELAELVVEGTIKATDGSKLKGSAEIHYFTAKSSVHGTQRRLDQPIKLKGLGNWMVVMTWVNGYAPAYTEVSSRDPQTGKASFELLLDRGYPGIFQLKGEDGEIIKDAKITYHVRLDKKTGGNSLNSHRVDEQGLLEVGQVNQNTSLGVDVFAHGYQWEQWESVSFQSGKPTVLVLKKAPPIVVRVLEQGTGKPIRGAQVYCSNRRSMDGRTSHGFGSSLMPEMSRKTSDEEGFLTVDVARDRVLYDVWIKAPGYAYKSIRGLQVGGKSVSLAEMSQELRLKGQFNRGEGKDRVTDWHRWLSIRLDNNHFWNDSIALEGDDETLNFDLSGLEAGKGFLECNGMKWHFDLQKSMTDVSLVPHQGKWVVEGSEASKHEIVKRIVNFDLVAPTGSPPYDGEITVIRSEGQKKLTKVHHGRLTLEVEVPGSVRLSPDGMNGYCFPSFTVNVDAIEAPLLAPISLIPSGAISGKITRLGNDDDTMFGYVMLENHVRDGNGKYWHPNDGSLTLSQDRGLYFASPLPLIGKYRLRLVSGMTLVESKSLSLSAEKPLLAQDMTIPRGETIQVIPEMDESTVNLRLYYQSPDQANYSWEVKRDKDDLFKIEGINFDVKGDYYLMASGGVDSAPNAVRLKSGMSRAVLKKILGITQEGRLLDSEGLPLSGQRLKFYRIGGVDGENLKDWERHHIYTNLPTDEQGSFQIRQLLPGRYWVYGENDKRIMDEELSLPSSKSLVIRMRK